MNKLIYVFLIFIFWSCNQEETIETKSTSKKSGQIEIKDSITFCVYKKWRIRTPKLSANAEL
jgi:hypothetical protein